MSFRNNLFLLIYFPVLLIATTLYFIGEHGDTVLWANSWHNPVSDFLFKWITYLGDGFFFAIVTLGMLIRNWKTGLLLLSMGIMQSIVSFFLKRVVFKNQPRPRIYFEHFADINLDFVEGVKVHAYNSFPSGHTLTAFALATFMALYLGNKWLSLTFLLIACLTGFSRIYLAQHFLIDICMGSLLGVMIGLAFHEWHLKFQAHGASGINDTQN